MRLTITSLVLPLLVAACAHAASDGPVKYVGKTKYLNNARAVVSHSTDDSTKFVPNAIDALDKYDIKATLFISTDEDPAPEDRFLSQLLVRELWPRLEQAVKNGHEIGCHLQTHPCPRPDNETNCHAAYTSYEVTGSRDEILKHTSQPHVWTWCYPCGNCANVESIQKEIAAAGFVVARNYPDESHDGHIRPNLQTWAENPFNAGYTQVVQKRGGAAKTAIVDPDVLNAKFDEIYQSGGIYNFMSHPQWLDYGPDGFYEKHLAHISRKADVWYVPMGPLYAYKTIHDQTDVRPLGGSKNVSKFALSNNLDRKIYSGSITLEFSAAAGTTVRSNGKLLSERKGIGDTWNQEYFQRDGDRLFVTVLSNTTLEFRSSTTRASR